MCSLSRTLANKLINNIFDFILWYALPTSDFIWPFLRPYMGVIPNPKMAYIFPISCILALIFPIFIKYFPKYEEKGSFPKSQIKSLPTILYPKWFWKKLHAGNQAEMLHLGIAMVNRNSSWLKFFKNFYKISIPSVSFIVIDRLLDKNGKNSVFYTKFRRVLEESKIQRTLVICFRVWCKKEKVRLDAI